MARKGLKRENQETTVKTNKNKKTHKWQPYIIRVGQKNILPKRLRKEDNRTSSARQLRQEDKDNECATQRNKNERGGIGGQQSNHIKQWGIQTKGETPQGVSCPKLNTGTYPIPDSSILYHRKKTNGSKTNRQGRTKQNCTHNYCTNPLALSWRRTLD